MSNLDIKFKRLTPFKRCVLQNFPFIEEDFDALTNYGLLCKVVKYLNDVIASQNEVQGVTEEIVAAFNNLYDYVKNYFDNLDVQDEIDNKLDQMVEDGTLQTIIAEFLNYPQGMTLDARRFGRKLFYGDSPNNNNPTGNSVAFNMQGGCKINATQCVYVLWDSLNQSEDTNKVVIMDLEDGSIDNYANYNFGWCNSVAYKDGKIYIAVRGTHEGYSGDIKVLNATTLALEDTITMDFNVNAIYYFDKFYLLEEGTGNIHTFESLDGTDTTITLDTDGVYYHQNLYVDDSYIYLLSSLPNNTISLYNKTTGARVRSYNTPKYGGQYRIGEVQWIDKLDDKGNLILASDILQFEECIAQFFKINFQKNVDADEFAGVYALSVYCNSDYDHFDANGSASKPFTSINEAMNLNADNITVTGNDKTYKYAYLSDEKYARFLNCNFSEGAFIQYGNYEFKNCQFGEFADSRAHGNIFCRSARMFFELCTFNFTDLIYSFKDEGYCEYKFTAPTWNGTSPTFNTNISTSVVHLNSGNGMPYIPRAYNVEYPMMTSGTFDQYAVDTYEFETSLSTDQITELIENCSHIVVTYSCLGKSDDRKVIKNKKTGNDSYFITDLSISTNGTQNEKISQCQFRITNTGVEIRNSTYQNNAGGTITQSTSPTSGQAIHIKQVSFINMN